SLASPPPTPPPTLSLHDALPIYARRQAGGTAAHRRLLAGAARTVGSEIAVARPPRAAGRESRHRPQGDQPGRDPRLLAPDGLDRPAHLPVRDHRRATGLRSGAGQEAAGRGGLSQWLRRRRVLSLPAVQ